MDDHFSSKTVREVDSGRKRGGADRHCVWMVLCSLQPVSEDNARSGLWKGADRHCLDGAVFSPASVRRQCAKWTVEGGGQTVTVSGWCVFSPASVRRQFAKWAVKGGGQIGTVFHVHCNFVTFL